jgi:hypothetical protein
MSVKTIFTSATKSFKLFRILTKNDQFLDENARLNMFNKIAILPLTDNRDELYNSIKKIFGKKGYSRYIKRLIANKKYSFQHSLVPSRKVIRITETKTLKNCTSFGLPRLAMEPTIRMIDSKNAIFDFTSQFKDILPKNREMLNRPTVVSYFESIYPEIITRLMFNDEDLDKFKYLQKYTSSDEPPLKNMYSSLIIPIDINITNTKIINTYLLPEKKVPKSIYLDLSILKLLSICRFIVKLYNNYQIDMSDKDPLKYFLNQFSKHNVAFLFYNNKFSFVIDFNELREKRITQKAFYNLFKQKLILLISNNLGLQKDEAIDLSIEEENKEELDKENANKAVLIIDNVNKKVDKEVTNTDIEEPIDNTDKKILYMVRKNKEYEEFNNKLNQKNNSLIKLINKSNTTFIEIAKKITNDEEEQEEIIEDDDIFDENTNKKEDIIDDEKIDEEENINDIEEEPDNKKQDDLDVQINSQELSDEERKQLLKDLNKQQQPPKSPGQLKRIAVAKEKYKSIQADDGRTLEEILEDVQSKTIDHKIIKKEGIIDKSVLSTNLRDFEKSYIEKTYQQDIIKVVKSFSDNSKSLPLHIINLKEEDSSDRFNNVKTMKFTLEDENQKRHTLKFDIPVPDEDGFLYLNGSKKVLKKMKLPYPIIKPSKDTVIISSYANKVILERTTGTSNKNIIIINKLINDYLKEDFDNFSYQFGNNIAINSQYLTSIEYDDLAKTYNNFTFGKGKKAFKIYFNQREIRNILSKNYPNYKFSLDKMPVAIDFGKEEIIEFDFNNSKKSIGDFIISIIKEKGNIANIEKVISNIKTPKRLMYTKITIRNKEIPIIIFIAALYGLRNILTINKTKYTFSNKSIPNDDRYVIKFKDGYLYYEGICDISSALLLNGLNIMPTEDYIFDDFDTQIPYIEYMFLRFRSRNDYKGWTAFKETYMDPITLEVLRDFNLPTDFLELILYANDLLKDNTFINETSTTCYRIVGYEIIAHALYKSIQQEYEQLKQKNRQSDLLSIPQDIVLKKLNASQILEPYDSANPISELKAKATVTVKGNGVGGTKVGHGYGMDRRAFGEDAIGVFGLSNVEGGGIGTVNFLTNNPRILSTRGYIDTTNDKKEKEKMSNAEVLSPEELIQPMSARLDHPNRIAFSSIQFKHTIGVENPCIPFIGTGFEKTLACQIGNQFVKRPKGKGKVIDINENTKTIIVELSNSEKQSLNYGKDIMKNGSIYLENDLNLNCKIGDKVDENSVLAYNKHFFLKQNDDIIFTVGTIGKVAIYDSYYTEEDSSLISSEMSKMMTSPVIKREQISISKSSNIINMLKIGDNVLKGDKLMTFEDARDPNEQTSQILEAMGDVNEDASNLLSYQPKAPETGTIVDIDIYWSVPLDQLSNTCRKIINDYIKRIKEKIIYIEENTKKPAKELRYKLERSVPDKNRIHGCVIPEEGGIVIEYFIEHKDSVAVGWKLSTFPALKSVVAQVAPPNLTPYSESGPLDLVAGNVSIAARQISSIYYCGFIGKILHDMSYNIAKEYIE